MVIYLNKDDKQNIFTYFVKLDLTSINDTYFVNFFING